jgi:hypothetical protein
MAKNMNKIDVRSEIFDKLSPILDEEYKDLKTIDLILKYFRAAWRTFFPSRYHFFLILFLSITLISSLCFKLSKPLVFRHYILIVLGINLIPYFTYVFYSAFWYPRREEIKRRNSSTSYTQKLKQSISGRRTSLERSFEPDIEKIKIDKIINELLLFESSELERVELLLIHQNNLSEKNRKYLDKFVPICIANLHSFNSCFGSWW